MLVLIAAVVIAINWEKIFPKQNSAEGTDLSMIVTDSGLQYADITLGEGEVAEAGDQVSVHYTGKFQDGRVFDSSLSRGVPISFQLGVGRVIKGWDEALLDMKKGEKRVIIIPPQLGYGARGAGRVIPPNAWLVFDVELQDNIMF